MNETIKTREELKKALESKIERAVFEIILSIETETGRDASNDPFLIFDLDEKQDAFIDSICNLF